MSGRLSSSSFALLCALWLIWSWQICSVSSQEPNSVNGRSLRCCTLKEEPIVLEEKGKRRYGGFGGIAIEYLHKLEDRLDFQCSELKLFPNPESDSNGFSSFIKYMDSCSENGNSTGCDCDIGVSGWAIDEERIGLVDFVSPFIFDRFTVLVHISDTFKYQGPAFFLSAFDVVSWICIFVLIVLFTFLKMLDRRFAPLPETYRPLPRTERMFLRLKHFLLKGRILYRLRKAVISIAFRIVGHSDSDIAGDNGSTRQTILNFVVLLIGLFLILAYEASMTASLVQESLTSRYRSISDLQLCRIPPEQVCIPKGGAIDTFWENAIAVEDCHRGRSPQKLSSAAESVSALASRRCKYTIATGATAAYYVQGKYCGEVVETGEPFSAGGASFVLPRGSDMTIHMSRATLSLRKSNGIPSVEDWVKRIGTCEVVSGTTLTFERLRLFFILAFSACLVLFVEMIFDPQTAFRAEPQQDDTSEVEGSTENQEEAESSFPKKPLRVLNPRR